MKPNSIFRITTLGAITLVATLAACSSERSTRSTDTSAQQSSGATTAATVVAPSPVKPAAPTATAAPTDTAHAPASAGDSVRASAAGVGVVRFGTTVDVAARVAGGTVAHPPAGSCGFVSFRGLPHGVRFMVSYDTVVRADVDSARIATEAGARVGMTEDSVQHLYANKLRVTPHKYVRGGHYLASTPGAPADTMHRIVFETDGTRVTRYRAGLVPYVENVEGCG